MYSPSEHIFEMMLKLSLKYWWDQSELIKQHYVKRFFRHELRKMFGKLGPDILRSLLFPFWRADWHILLILSLRGIAAGKWVSLEAVRGPSHTEVSVRSAFDFCAVI